MTLYEPRWKWIEFLKRWEVIQGFEQQEQQTQQIRVEDQRATKTSGNQWQRNEQEYHED